MPKSPLQAHEMTHSLWLQWHQSLQWFPQANTQSCLVKQTPSVCCSLIMPGSCSRSALQFLGHVQLLAGMMMIHQG